MGCAVCGHATQHIARAGVAMTETKLMTQAEFFHAVKLVIDDIRAIEARFRAQGFRVVIDAGIAISKNLAA
jgi:hypothetical protein